MSNRPEPDHGRIRVYTMPGWQPAARSLEEYMRSRAVELIDAMIATEDRRLST